MLFIRVLIADPHRIILWGLRCLIDSALPRMGVIAECHSMAAALADCEKYRPDVVVLERWLQNDDTLITLPALRAAGARVVLFTSMERSVACGNVALPMGLDGLVYKEEDPATILHAIAAVHAGQRWSPGMLNAVKDTLRSRT